jgi:hypothetical protein
MNIWNKVLLGLIAVVLLPLVYFSLLALKTHQHWRSVANKIEAKLQVVGDEIQDIQFGSPKEGGDNLQNTRIELYKYYVDQGKIWRNCILQGQANNEVKVALSKPDPKGLRADLVVYAFDEAPIAQGGCYLGEFKVNAIDDKEGKWMTLEPTMRLQPRAIDRIKSGKGGWTLYAVLPNDMHEPFASLEKNGPLRAALPAAVLDEYLTDGKNHQVRQLRDYYVLLKELDRQETVLLEDVDATTRHEQYMQAATADAKKQELFQQDERTALTAQLTRMQTERDAAVAHEQSLGNELKQLETKIAQLIEDNRAVATDIARMQETMLRQVDRRSAVAAKP